MARSARMFEIIQILRSATKPLTAAEIADGLGVTKRTIYRDIASLQAMRVPIEGEAGIGYLMRSGYDLPPVNFTVEEAEAMTLGLGLIPRTGDKGLIKAATSAARKLSEAAPQTGILVSKGFAPSNLESVDLSVFREAIRDERKLRLVYRDEKSAGSKRVIRPIAMLYYPESVVVVAWCELRLAFRHFRPDRVQEIDPLEAYFKGKGASLRAEWEEQNKT